jgi:DNA repair protein RadC
MQPNLIDLPAAPAPSFRIPGLKVSVIRDGSIQSDAETLEEPSRVADLARRIIGDDEREHFLAFFVDARNRVKGYSVISIGTLSASLVHPRETYRPAIINGAAGVIVVHNHPSGDCSPSDDDRETTRRLKRAGEVVGVPLLDHVIIAAPSGYVSFRERGLL